MTSYKQILITIWCNFTFKQKCYYTLLSLGAIVVSVFEVLTISSVLPFLALVIDNAEIPTPYNIEKLKIILEKYSEDGVLIATLAFITLITLSTVIRVTAIFLNTYFSFSVGTDLSCKMLAKSLNIDFEEFQKQNSTFYVNSIMRKSGILMQNIVLGSIQIISNIIIISFILTTLFILHSNIIIYLTSVLFCIYVGIITLSSKITKKISSKLALVTTQAMQMLNEIYGSFVYLRITEKINDVINYYKVVDLKFRKAEAIGLFIAQAPRYVIEGLIIISCAVYIYILSMEPGEISNELYGFMTVIIALQRILPYAQQIYSNFISFKVYKDTACEIADLLNLPDIFFNKSHTDSFVSFEKVVFSNIDYRFSGIKTNLLSKLNLTINKGDWIAITGRTGSGKSTLLSIITGLLKPANGQIILDGNVVNLHDNIHWFKLISYVPQKPFFPDITVSDFITDEKKLSDLDYELMLEVIHICCLDDVFNSKNRKTTELLGENGSRFSGGQLQRLSIARELYKRNPILILDEATSALDISTQREILSNIKDHFPSLTVIMVAHRKEIFDQFSKQLELSVSSQ